MLLVETYLAPSSTHGIGVFAAEDIKEGTVLWEFTWGVDYVLSQKEFDSLPSKAKDFISEYGYVDRKFMDGIVICADNTRFLNHSDSPNADNSLAVAIAKRNIEKGEGITCDYRELCEDYAELPYVGNFHAAKTATS